MKVTEWVIRRFKGESEPIRDRSEERAATIGGALGMILLRGSPFILFGVISLDKVLNEDMHGPFRLGNVPIPYFDGAGATNLYVFSFCVFGFVAVLIAVLMRYLHYRKDLEYLRSKGIRDANNDGKVDSFGDSWLDDL